MERTEIRVDNHWLLADVTPRPGGLPPRFSGPVPSRLDDFGSAYGAGPPKWWIVRKLREGDDDMGRRVLDAALHVSEEEAEPYAWQLSVLLAKASDDPRGAAFARTLLAHEGLSPALAVPLRADFERRMQVDSDIPVVPTETVSDYEFDTAPFFEAFPGALVDPNLAVEVRGGVTVMLARRPEAREAAIAALASCIERSTGRLRLERLEELLSLDEEAARSVVARVPELGPLARFAQPGAAEDYARTHALPWAGGVRMAFTLGLAVEYIFLETDCYPNGYDGDLMTLAARVPALADVIFDEIPPWGRGDRVYGDDEEEDESARHPDMLEDAYRVFAYEGGRVWEIICGDASDWIDPKPLLGLLDALLADRGAPERFFLLEGDGARADVFVAPPAGVAAAVRDGVLALG